MTEESDQIDIETITAKLPLTVSEDDIEACRSIAADSKQPLNASMTRHHRLLLQVNGRMTI